jgi:hypothetical protein
MEKSLVICISGALLLGACSGAAKKYGPKRSSNVCPEFKNVQKTCLTQLACDLDEERGCEVCYCYDYTKPVFQGTDGQQTDEKKVK